MNPFKKLLYIISNKINHVLLVVFITSGCAMDKKELIDQLIKLAYQSVYEADKKEAFVYLPRNYKEKTNDKWLVILFLHGNGERGDSKIKINFVLMHGPIYEAWIQKRDLPFIIISPQLSMLGKEKEAAYLRNRDEKSIPKRQEIGKPNRPERFTTNYPMLVQLLKIV